MAAVALGAIFVIPTTLDAKAAAAEAKASAAERQAAIAERESRMLQYYVLELDGKMMAGGVIPPARGYTEWRKERDRKE